ncbi:MAG: EscU/YscU/HrcU family type III secretion system export apparatus switch protein [Spirochaetota bacterium]
MNPPGQGKLQEILRACALEFRGDDAPVVRWYAEGDAARRLLELARQRGVRIEEDQAEELLLALRGVKLNSRIPREIYLAVAKIYAYILAQGTQRPT